MEKNLPKVLAISLNTWRKDSGIHTQTDLFKFWDPDQVAQIYLKSDLPDTPVCNKFFRISEMEIIRSAVNRKPVGVEVQNGAEQSKDEQKSVNEEQKLYKFAHKKKSWFFTVVRELVWKMANWKTKELDKFVQEVNPDVYFVPIYPVAYTGWLQWHIIKKYPRPYVCYLWDDNYSYKACRWNLWAWLHRWILRKINHKLATNCTAMFTITKTQAVETDQEFGTHSIVLTKGIDYTNLKFHNTVPSNPIKMVYTGNLLIGRAKSLVEIANAMKTINKDSVKVVFDIYTTTQLDKKTTQILNSYGCTMHPPVPKSQVAEIQNNADIVVFVESLEKEHRYSARLSFSTKLTDYFASGKCVFAIGDEEIAPIKYLEEYACAVISTEYSQILENLTKLVEKPDLILKYGRKAFETGRMNHEQRLVKSTFIETIVKASGC